MNRTRHTPDGMQTLYDVEIIAGGGYIPSGERETVRLWGFNVAHVEERVWDEERANPEDTIGTITPVEDNCACAKHHPTANT